MARARVSVKVCDLQMQPKSGMYTNDWLRHQHGLSWLH